MIVDARIAAAIELVGDHFGLWPVEVCRALEAAQAAKADVLTRELAAPRAHAWDWAEAA